MDDRKEILLFLGGIPPVEVILTEVWVVTVGAWFPVIPPSDAFSGLDKGDCWLVFARGVLGEWVGELPGEYERLEELRIKP